MATVVISLTYYREIRRILSHSHLLLQGVVTSVFGSTSLPYHYTRDVTIVMIVHHTARASSEAKSVSTTTHRTLKLSRS